MRTNRLWPVGLVVFLAAVAFSDTQASPTTEPAGHMAPFVRFVGNSVTGGTLQTAEVTYQNDAGIRVDLVAAVHIADADYYRKLNESFRNFDAVLYEMVKPKGMAPPGPGESNSDISRLQRFLKNTLDLQFQLDAIDYDAKNFIHADLDSETFRRMEAERGESFASLMLSAILRSLANPAANKTFKGEPTDTVDLMTRPDGTRQFKLILARRMGDIEHHAMGLGALNGTVLLTERNKAAIRVLRQTIASGKKHIAIFYGAAHMPDLADRLDLLGFKPVKTIWRQAWDVHIRNDQPSAFQRLMEMAAKAATQPAPK